MDTVNRQPNPNPPALSIELVKKLAVLHLEPNDVIVFMTQYKLSETMMERIIAGAKLVCPGHEVMILDEGLEVGVLRPAKP